MPRIHPDDLALERLVDSLKRAGLDRAFAHLVSCRDCQTRAHALVADEAVNPRPLGRVLRWTGRPDYTLALGRGSRELMARARAFEHERADAAELWHEIGQRPFDLLERALGEDPRCRSWGMVEVLLEASRERLPHDPGQGERLGALARSQVDRLDSEFYGSARLADLAARCLAQIARSRSAGADLFGAERACEEAELLLRSGTRDPLERAELWTLLAALQREQSRLDEAEHLFLRALDIFRAAGEPHRAGRCQVALADLARATGNLERAIERLRDALPLLEPALEPGLELVARHNLISFLAEAGLYLAGRRLLAESRPVYRRFPAPRVQARRAWVEGRITLGLGQLVSAERAFRIAREGLAREGLNRDTAQVSLELADALLRQQRSREAGEIAEVADAHLRESSGPAGSAARIPSPEFPFPGLGRSEFAAGS